MLAVVASCVWLRDFDELQGGARPDGGAGDAAGAGAGGQAGSPSLLLEDFSSALVEAACANLLACASSAAEVVLHDQDCRELYSPFIHDQVVAPINQSLARDAITYDEGAAADQLQSLIAATEQVPPQCMDFAAAIEDIKLVLGGLVGEGDACRHSFECQRGLRCQLDSCPGVCRRLAQQDQACAANSDCDPTQSLYCRGVADADAGADAGTVKTCQRYLALDADCVTNQDQCVPGGICMNGSCRRISTVFTLSEADPCYANGFLCDRGLSCEFSGLPFLSQGACVAGKQMLDACLLAVPGECPTGSYCSANAFNADGQCLATPTENQPCANGFEQAIGVSSACVAGLACIEGICKPIAALSGACEADAQCYSGVCGSAAVCVVPGCP
jgi:hypothetical protein